MRTRARIPRAERKEQTRQDLIEAADRVFCERGFHAASLDLVAAEAGYTKGAVYSNFRSKEDLFFAVYERRVAKRVEQMRRIMQGPPDEARRLIVRATLRTRRSEDDGWLAVFFEFWAHVLRNPPLRRRFAGLHARGRSVLAKGTRREWERDGIAIGIGPDRFTAAVFAMMTGLSLEQLTDPEFDSTGVAEAMMDVVLAGVRASGSSDGTT